MSDLVGTPDCWFSHVTAQITFFSNRENGCLGWDFKFNLSIFWSSNKNGWKRFPKIPKRKICEIYTEILQSLFNSSMKI